jgi:F-type H+-transporting ATPase subunit gamma
VLRRRIRSIQSTQKITRAVELIAASRIVRAQQAITAAAPYAQRMREVIADLSAAPEVRSHPLFAGTGGAPVVVVMGADRGLCGAFNVSVLRAAEEVIADAHRQGETPIVVGVGRKVQSYFRFRGRSLDDTVTGITDRPKFEDAQRVARAVIEALSDGRAGSVTLVCTDFVNVASQRVEKHQMVPLKPVEERASTVSFDFEPDPAEILERLLPLWLEAELYVALLGSAASFHVAQQRAMKAATDNADDLVKTLTRSMNRARQDAITTEIMEIVGGAEALRQAGLSEALLGRPDVYVFPEAS